MTNWQQYFNAQSKDCFYVNPSKGFHGISSVRKHLCDVIRAHPRIKLTNSYCPTIHSVVVNIDFFHFLLRRHINTYIFHDAIAYKFLPKWKQLILKFVQERLLRRAETVVCISKYAQDELQKYHPKHYERSIVIYNEIDPQIKKKYVLWVGNKKTHKGLEKALQCSETLDCKLLLIGVRKVPKKYKNCVCLINLPTEVYIAVIKNASALLVTSYDEGFHLPTFEALVLNTSVFALNITPFQEIYGTRIRSYNSIEELTQDLKQHVASCE